MSDEFSVKAIHRCGIDLYCTDDAITLIKLLQGKAVPVLGLDAFIITEENTAEHG